MLGASPAAVGIFSGPDNDCLFANPKFVELLGINVDPLGLALADLVTDPSHQILASLVRESQTTRSPVNRLDLRLNQGGLGENAQQRYFHFFAHPLGRIEGMPEQRVVYLRDISEQRAADERLLASERKFRRLFSSDLLGIFFWDVHGKITEANHSLLILLGYAGPELAGQTLASLTPPEFRSLDLQQIEMLSVQEHTVPFEKELIKKDGTRVPVVVGSGWISKSSGEGFSFVMDRTEQRRAGEERARLQGRADSEKEASRLKSQFLANMSHEIRTPLHAILGLTNFLHDSSLTAEQAGYVRAVSRAGQNLLHLTNDLLDLSRIEAKGVRLELESINIINLITEVVEMVRAALPEAVPIHVRGLGPVPQIRGDRVRLSQIFTNILTNAAKFTAAGQIEIQISSVELGEGECELTVVFKDSGVGIPAHAITKLFAPFVQADTPEGARVEGSGLGLWISRSLAELMGGTVELTSQESVGTTVTARMRLALSLTGEAPAPQITAIKARPRLAGRVLVAEDNEMNQLIAEKLLRREGHNVTIAANGEETLRALTEASFDLLLLDCQMPDIDGYSVARAIRARESTLRLPPTPILAVTADAMAHAKQRCQESGMNDYVSKPFDHELFLSKVNALLDPSLAPAAHSGSKASINKDTMAALHEVDGTGLIFEELKKIFSSKMPGRLDRLEACAARGDQPAMLDELHSLRACFGSMGLNAAADRCAGLEAFLSRGSAAAHQTEIPLIRRDFNEGLSALAAWNKDHPPTLKDGA